MENQLFVQHFQFNDFDHFSEMIKQGKLEQSQLDRGDFKGSLSHIAHGPINISRHKMNQTILQRGCGHEGNIIFMIPGNMEQRINWRKNDLRGNCIGILKSGMEHESVTLPNFFGFSVSISTKYLAELSVLLGFSRFMEVVKTSELIVIKKVDAREIQKMISNIFKTKLFVESKLTFQLPKLIISTISNRDRKIQNYSDRSHNLIFKEAQSFIEYNIREKINILNLSKELGISERTLRNVFNNKIGFGPKMYTYNLRLNKVRKELKLKSNMQINVVANEYGFWHSGKFAADYKMLFGELPSETKKST